MRGAPELKRPNVLLISIDTLRADRLGCYGHPGGLTPNLDRIAEGGMRFSQAITGGSWTQAAFPVLLTSTYASMYGGCLGPLSQFRPSPVEAFAKAGYRTAGFTSSPLLSRRMGYARGFDDFFDLESGDSDPLIRNIKAGHALLRSPLAHRISSAVGATSRPKRPYAPANQVVEQVSQWVAAAAEPFLAWVHLMDAHWPYHLDEDMSHPNSIARAWRDLSKMHRVNWQGDGLNGEQRKRFIDLYEKAVQFVDAQVGLLLDHVDRSARLDNTIIVVVSDHGEEFLERSHWGHVEINLHDEIIRVPLLIKLPGGSQARAIEHQVRTLDIMPTLVELCGIPKPEAMLGESLRSLWTKPSQYQERIAICERWREQSHMIAVRTSSYKYIWNSRETEKPKLYDLVNDPDEQKDVIAERPEIASGLSRYVNEQLARMDSTWRRESREADDDDKAVVARLKDLGYIE